MRFEMLHSFINPHPRCGLHVPGILDRDCRAMLAPDENDFRHAFCSAWLDLPLDVRRAIAKFWDDDPDEPTVELAQLDPDKLATVRGGRHFRFDRNTVTTMPPAIAADLVIHELAHAHQLALDLIFRNIAAQELHADLHIDQWRPGSVLAVDAWMRGERIFSGARCPLTPAEIARRSQRGGRYEGAK